jgi:hypothetical protein
MIRPFFFLFFTGFLIAFNLKAQTEENYYAIAKERLNQYEVPRKDFVIVIDYTKNIFSERLYVLDMKSGKSVISSKVSHAFNSGELYATDFSNEPGTNKSCRGNFQTLHTQMGPQFGFGMQLKGLDKGINDRARERAIIFHSSKHMLSAWSYGCFATDEETNRKIIELTKGGCLVAVIHQEK